MFLCHIHCCSGLLDDYDLTLLVIVCSLHVFSESKQTPFIQNDLQMKWRSWQISNPVLGTGYQLLISGIAPLSYVPQSLTTPICHCGVILQGPYHVPE